MLRLKIDLRNVLKGDVVVRRPSCKVATRSMKTAKQDTKMRTALTPVKLIGNHDQKSAAIRGLPVYLGFGAEPTHMNFCYLTRRHHPSTQAAPALKHAQNVYERRR